VEADILQSSSLSVHSFRKAVLRAQKVNPSISQYCMCEYISQGPGEVFSTDFVDGFIANNFRLLYVLSKVHDLPND
jgi:hypothetical protein